MTTMPEQPAGTPIPWKDLIGVAIIALVVRSVCAFLVEAPPWTDSAYYFASAERLATGHGLSVPFVWSFLETGGQLTPQAELPIPSHAHWMPLTSFVVAAGMEALGPTWRSAQVPMVLMSTLLTPLTYWYARTLFRSRVVAIVGSLLVVFAGPLLFFGSIVENFAVFGLAGSGALFAAMRSVADQSRWRQWLLVSGLLVGIASLARIEGVLLAVATATAWLIGMRRTGWRGGSALIGWLAGTGAFLAFLAVVTPWAVRNVLTFGAVLPSTGGHTLWIKSFNEQFSITADTSLAAYLAQGPIAIIGSKLAAWLTVGGYVLGLLAGVFGAFFVAGLWLQRRRPEFAPFIAYFLVMLLIMGGLFTFHAPHGLFYHHAAAWLPIAAPMAVWSVAPTASAAARWWRFLGRPATHRFLIVVTFSASVLFSIVSSGMLFVSWQSDLRAVRAVADFLVTEGEAGDVVMHRDAPLLHVVSGHPAVAPPNDPFPVIERVARAYGARWYVAQLQSIGANVEPQGLWSGGRSVDAEGNRADWLADQPSFEDDRVRVYEVLAAD